MIQQTLQRGRTKGKSSRESLGGLEYYKRTANTTKVSPRKASKWGLG